MSVNSKILKIIRKVNPDVNELHALKFYSSGTYTLVGDAQFNLSDSDKVAKDLVKEFGLVDITLGVLRSVDEITKFVKDAKKKPVKPKNDSVMIDKKAYSIEFRANSYTFFNHNTNQGIDVELNHKDWKAFDKWYSKNCKKLLKKKMQVIVGSIPEPKFLTSSKEIEDSPLTTKVDKLKPKKDKDRKLKKAKDIMLAQ